MSLNIRPVANADLDRVRDLLLLDAGKRQKSDPGLWKPKRDARGAVAEAITDALRIETPPFRQRWLAAEAGERIVGLAHTIRLPVPPIYAGEFGAPGLIMDDGALAEDAPPGTAEILLDAAEADLVESGAGVLLASSIIRGAWERALPSRGYTPLTLYFTRSDLPATAQLPSVRHAVETDIASIVSLSAINLRILSDLDGFWRPHTEAGPRFGNWMKRSLTLADRDMLVSEVEGEIAGYAISQPATALHFPPAHDISRVGFIDDFFHREFENPSGADRRGQAAAELLLAAEAALAERGDEAVLIVCPAAWTSKRSLLEATGHRVASTWHIKGRDGNAPPAQRR